MISDRFSFFVSGEEQEVSPGSWLWQHPLSGEHTNTVPVSSQRPEFTIGDYFTAASNYLKKDKFSSLLDGLGAALNQKVRSVYEVKDVHLFLEKHGAFYHPIKLSVYMHDKEKVNLVLNGAVSLYGLSLVESEYGLISRLYEKIKPNQFLPRVFGSGVIQTAKGPIGFFLGQWFDGFKEFHVTHHQAEEKLVIWDSDGSCSYLTFCEAFSIYREIARILTCLYDLETFEQVFPWHHAAGDFIVGYDAGMIQVKLITVRGYAPLTELDFNQNNSAAQILPSLLFFFVHLSVRMRLDRFDGTGDLTFLDEQIVIETTKGFLEALDEKSIQSNYNDISQSFKTFFCQFDLEQLIAIMENILNSYQQQSEEIELIRQNLDSHCRILHSIFKNA